MTERNWRQSREHPVIMATVLDVQLFLLPVVCLTEYTSYDGLP